MYVKLVLSLAVLCAVISGINSEKTNDGRPYMQGYTRIKRGKYNSSPQRFYSRPPVSFPVKGIYSYTPPPNYKPDEDDSQYPGPPSYPRPKVSTSRRPTNDGLGEEDINNIVKYLSKQDLDKIIDLAGGKDRDSDAKDQFEKYNEVTKPNNDFKQSQNFDLDKYSPKPFRNEDSKLFKALVQEIDTDPKYTMTYQEPKQFNVEYKKPSDFNADFVTQPTPPEAYLADIQNHNHLYDPAALAAEESMIQRQIAYLQSQINDGVVYTDSKVMPEENLPKPLNLREEHDYDASYTNNVPTVVDAKGSSSYKLENFGDLPLMNYNSKLDTLSSYHVPHYTVTSPSKPSSSSSSSSYSAPSYAPPSPYGPKAPPIEPAPPASAAKSQSDAHLKAVRIWSHKSKGTAYTLHNDGSLSLERPGRPKGSYGYP